MTPSNASALTLPGPPRRAQRDLDPRSLAAARMAARRHRARMIRKWSVALAVTLFLSVAIVIAAQSHLVTGSKTATAAVSASSATSSSASVTSSSSSGSGASSPSASLSTGQS